MGEEKTDFASASAKSAWTLEILGLAAALTLAAAGLVAGWKLFWFFTDDAFISFRYISNAHLGYGYVWNPPPFRPVEGYTNFLWVVLLDALWRVLGVLPPQSANYVTLLFSGLALWILARMVFQMPWRPELRSWRVVFVAWALAFVLLNRTFLAWTSSGLETAMFTFFVVAWVRFSTRLPEGGVRTQAAYALCAALAALTRPDGLLLVAASGLVLFYTYAMRWKTDGLRSILSAFPLALPLAHMAWRRSFYGEWLPNTYYAKIVAPWPESGIRYMASFILEYALWFGFALALAAVAMWLAKPQLRPRMRWGLLLSGAALTLHFLYYGLLVGGDHFEYRVYHHLVVLAPFATLLLLNRLSLSAGKTLAVASVFLALSLPVPWTHWALTHNLNTREKTRWMFAPIAPAWPRPVRWYAQAFDELQSTMIRHNVCTRHQGHKIFFEHRSQIYPPRQVGAKIDGKDFPVLLEPCVGVAAWTLPHVVILDYAGLNDYVAARNPVSPDQKRMMAHDRAAPDWYIKAFRPNVDVKWRVITHTPREKPLTEDDIRLIEERSWAWAKQQRKRRGAWPPTPPPDLP